MANSATLKLACIVLMCMVFAAPQAEAAITCGLVAQKLAPCISYLQKGGLVSTNCCDGVKSLNGMAKTTPDRQTACGCLKSASGSISGLNFGLAAGLPGKCGVNIPYKISPSTDCSKVK